MSSAPSHPGGSASGEDAARLRGRPRLTRRTVLGSAAGAAGALTVAGGWNLTRPRSMPSLRGATTWLGTEPLFPADLAGHVVLVQFWTFTCINWIRTAPHVRAWWRAYRDDGLIVIGVHTPEFTFERDLAEVRRALPERSIDYPVAVDNDYRIWDAFANNYWPALYFMDRDGVETHHVFGEGSYEDSERRIQRLLGVERDLASVTGQGVEAEADWDHLRTSETYLGSRAGFGAAQDAPAGQSHDFELPAGLAFNQWGLDGNWTIEPEKAVLNQAGGKIAFRFSSRDVHLVLRAPDRRPIPFRVSLDGEAPGASHGVDVGHAGDGVLRDARLYQLARVSGPVRERVIEIQFDLEGVEAYAFTFG